MSPEEVLMFLWEERSHSIQMQSSALPQARLVDNLCNVLCTVIWIRLLTILAGPFAIVPKAPLQQKTGPVGNAGSAESKKDALGILHLMKPCMGAFKNCKLDNHTRKDA